MQDKEVWGARLIPACCHCDESIYLYFKRLFSKTNHFSIMFEANAEIISTSATLLTPLDFPVRFRGPPQLCSPGTLNRLSFIPPTTILTEPPRLLANPGWTTQSRHLKSVG
jgi:hypothetical protein